MTITRRGRGWVWLLVLAAPTLMQLVAPTAAIAAESEGGTGGGDLMGPLNPRDVNDVPIDRYDIYADTGGITNIAAKILWMGTNGLFALTRWIVGLASWLVQWVLEFEVTRILLGPVNDVLSVFESEVIDRGRLIPFALLFAAFICGTWILFGRTSKGISEIGMTFIVAGIAGTILAAPGTVIFGDNGLLNQTRDTSTEVASLTLTGQGSNRGGDSDEVGPTVRDMFVGTFVRTPHQLLNFGTVLDRTGNNGPHECLDVYNDIVADGPWGDDSEPRDRMSDCDEELAAFAAEPTWDRLGAALLTVTAAVIVGVLAIIMALALLAAQLWLVFEAIRLLFALVIGLLPGRGRAVLWRAIGGLIASLATVVVTILALALFVVIVRALLAASDDQALVVRFLLINIAAFWGLAFYRRIVKAGRQVGQDLSARFGRNRAPVTPTSPRTLATESTRELRKVARPVGAGIAGVGELRPSRVAARTHQTVNRVKSTQGKLGAAVRADGRALATGARAGARLASYAVVPPGTRAAIQTGAAAWQRLHTPRMKAEGRPGQVERPRPSGGTPVMRAAAKPGRTRRGAGGSETPRTPARRDAHPTRPGRTPRMSTPPWREPDRAVPAARRRWSGGSRPEHGRATTQPGASGSGSSPRLRPSSPEAGPGRVRWTSPRSSDPSGSDTASRPARPVGGLSGTETGRRRRRPDPDPPASPAPLPKETPTPRMGTPARPRRRNQRPRPSNNDNSDSSNKGGPDRGGGGA